MIKDLDNNLEDLKTEALHGTQDPVGFAQNLAHRFLLVHSEQYIQYHGKDQDQFPKARVQATWEHFFNQILQQDHQALFYEFCLLTQRKSQVFPVNFLVKVLDYLGIHPELADYAFPILGEAGQFLCRQNPDWHWLDSTKWEKPLWCKESAKRLFMYRRFLESKNHEAFHFFLEHVSDFSEKEQAAILEYALHAWPVLTEEQTEQLLKSVKPKNVLLLYPHIFKDKQNPISIQSKLWLESLLLKPSSLQEPIPPLKKKQKEYTLAQYLEIIPPTWITERQDAKKILQKLAGEDLLQSILESVRKYKDVESAKFLANWLIDNHAFTEDLEVAKLSSCMNFEIFNQVCITAIRKLGPQIDLEAFLHFILAEKHFWSDDLLIAVLDLHQHERLRREYDLEVFYAMIPYRINPNTSRLEEIPKSLYHLHEAVLSFERVLQFRRLLRK